jgi:hypothetical protein
LHDDGAWRAPNPTAKGSLDRSSPIKATSAVSSAIGACPPILTHRSVGQSRCVVHAVADQLATDHIDSQVPDDRQFIFRHEVGAEFG